MEQVLTPAPHDNTADDFDAILEASNICVSYGQREVLHDLTFRIPRNAVTAIIGPSGCGKSTLLHSLDRLILDEPGAKLSGTVLLDGRDVSTLGIDEVRRLIGLVFQSPSPFPFSVRKNVEYALKYFKMGSRDEIAAIVRSSLERVGLYDELEGDLNRGALKLSGGQQQRLCIARALAVRPQVLLLDEPCSALDVKNSAVIENVLSEGKSDFTSIIVTHNIAQAKRIADYAICLYQGEIVEAGWAADFFEHPQNPHARDFLDGAFG